MCARVILIIKTRYASLGELLFGAEKPLFEDSMNKNLEISLYFIFILEAYISIFVKVFFPLAHTRMHLSESPI